MRLILVAVVLVAGCCPAAIVGEEVPPPDGADEAIEIIHAAYMDAFESPRVDVSFVWVESIERDGVGLVGFSAACDAIWLSFAEMVSDTSMAHEMAHCYAGDMAGSGCFAAYDNSHSQEWIWDPKTGVVEVTDQHLRDLGL